MAKGLLIASFDFSTAQADEFHDWYDLEHVPEREAVSGFGACERWIGADDPNQAVATYTNSAGDTITVKADAMPGRTKDLVFKLVADDFTMMCMQCPMGMSSDEGSVTCTTTTAHPACCTECC